MDTSSKDFKKPSARFHASGVLSAGPSASVRSSSPNPGSDRNTAASSMTEHCGPRLIVFVVGGFTLSEARVGYQLTQRVSFFYRNWNNIFIAYDNNVFFKGSITILTFINFKETIEFDEFSLTSNSWSTLEVKKAHGIVHIWILMTFS